MSNPEMLSQDTKQERSPGRRRSASEPQLSFWLQAAKIMNEFIFFCLLAVLVLAVIPYGTVDAWWDAAFQISVFVITALWIFESLLRGNWQLKNFQVLLPMIAISAYVFLQTVRLPGNLAGWLNPANASSPWVTIDRYQTELTTVP